MATTQTFAKIQDPELASWPNQDSAEPREILVDAALPAPQVSFHRGTDGRFRPSGLRATPPAERRATLQELGSVLSGFLDSKPVLLEAAGAVAIRALSWQVRRFLDHPLVKALRLNRRHHLRA
jgi:hypothetical protein